MPANKAQPKTYSTVGTITAVLRCFTVDEPERGVTDIAESIGLHKSSVSRVLSTLEKERVVVKDPETKRYQLSWGLLSLAGPLLAHLDIRKIAYPLMRDLADLTLESVSLLVWDGDEAIVVEQVPSKQTIKHETPIGKRYRGVVNSCVRVFHAFIDGPAVAHELSAERISPWKEKEYEDRLKQVKHVGFAVNIRETSPDEVGISAPIMDHRGEVAGVLLLAAPAYRVDDKTATRLRRNLVTYANQISANLGHIPATVASSAT